jgi:hypothetical protein
MQIAEGLEAAHRHDLIHRDVKPANILLEDGSGGVKITDFGLARAGEDASITHSGQIVGTPMYMSPEQAEGKKLDHRSDLFSFGSVLYALCTGRPPFRAKGTVAVLRRVCDFEPRPVRQINPAIPAWLEKVILKLLEKDRADRYQTAGEVGAVLRDHLTERSTPSQSAAPPPKQLELHAGKNTMSAAPAAPAWRKKPLIIGGLLGLAGLLVAGTLAAWIVYGRTHGPGDNPSVKGDAAGKPEPVAKDDASGKPGPGEEKPDKLVGSWKGRIGKPLGPVVGEIELVSTYNKDGSYREQAFDLQGRPASMAQTGRWQFRDGELHLSDDIGFVQRIAVTWIDSDTMDRLIVAFRAGSALVEGVAPRRFMRLGPADKPGDKKEATGKPESGKGILDKLVGTWKGRVSPPVGPTFDSVMTYNKDGSYREQAFDLQGRPAGVATGRWQFREGQIHVSGDNGRSLSSTVKWIDDDTIDLRIVIVDTRPPPLVQPTVRFHRQ